MDLVLASTEPGREDCPDRKYSVLDVRTLVQGQAFINYFGNRLKKFVAGLDEDESVEIVKDGDNATFKVSPDIHRRVSIHYGDIVTTCQREFHRPAA